MTPQTFAAFDDAVSHLLQLGGIQLPPNDLAEFAAAARAAEARMRDAGEAAVADIIGTATTRIIESAAAGDAALQAALREWVEALRARLPWLPVSLVADGFIPLQRAVTRIGRALGDSDGETGLGMCLAALGRALPAMAEAGQEAVAAEVLRHVDYLAAESASSREALLAGESPRAPALVVATSLGHVATILEADAPPPPRPPERPPTGAQAGAGLASLHWRRVLHMHIPKCAGTSLNRWLDMLAGDERSWSALTQRPMVRRRLRHVSSTAPTAARDVWRALNTAAMGRLAFGWAEVVHDHRNLLPYAPPQTLRLTVLREPVSRLVSKVADWRRLGPESTIDRPAAMGRLVADSARLPLLQFLQRYRFGRFMQHFDNAITRSLAAGRIGRLARTTTDADLLLAEAVASLEHDYEVVGLTEALDLTRNAIAERLGLPPVSGFTRLNESRSSRVMDEEGATAAAELADLTRLDAVVYARARELFEARHRATAEAWTDSAFEARDAAATTALLRGDFDGMAIRHGVRGPLIGRGFHARDGAGTPECVVWSGPDPVLVLYLPVPEGLEIELLLWVRGYADLGQRARLAVRVDGQRVPHAFEPCPGWAERIVVPFRPNRPFVRLEFDVGETVAAPPEDPRPRGLAFDAYGWRPA